MFHSPAQISHPEWSAVADHDAAQAVVARQTLLTELARPNTIGFACHVGDQPFGRIMTSGTGAARWVPSHHHSRATTARLGTAVFGCCPVDFSWMSVAPRKWDGRHRGLSSRATVGCLYRDDRELLSADVFRCACGLRRIVRHGAWCVRLDHRHCVGDPASAPETPAAVSACPTAAPQNGGTPEWTLPGTTGSVAVTGSTDETAPLVKVEAPFSVAETQVRTLQAGDGPVVADTATVSVCYMGVNGRDGTVFDSSYERGAPAQFSLDGVVPGFQKAIAGQKVGSTVAVAMASADGYPDGQPSAGIQKGDSLIFAIKILDASN